MGHARVVAAEGVVGWEVGVLVVGAGEEEPAEAQLPLVVNNRTAPDARQPHGQA